MKKTGFVISLFLAAWVGISTAATTSTITQWGITWIFDKEYEYGRFVNGDYWVVGTVNIIHIDPCSTDVGGRVKNGSMIDPNGDNNHTGTDTNTNGFDSLATGFDAALNVARPNNANLTASNPLIIEPDASLVSAKSFDADKGSGAQVEDFAILTILNKAPQEDSFRPAFASSDKSIKYNLTDVNLAAFSELAVVGRDAPSFADIIGWFKYPGICIAHSTRSNEIGGNRVSQHDDYVEHLNASLLYLNCNPTNKRKLIPAIHILQHGIDRYGTLTENAGGRIIWRGNGAWHLGVKLTIVVTAKILGDDAMMADITAKSGDYWESGKYGRQEHWPATTIPPDLYYFSEDTDTFTITRWDIGTPPFVLWSHTGSYRSASKYQDKGNVKVTKGSTKVVGVGTTWNDVNWKGDTVNDPNVWFGVVGDDQAYSRSGRVYDVASIVSDTEITLATPYTGETNQSGNARCMIGTAIGYGHRVDPGGWNAYRGADINEPPEEHLGWPDWISSYVINGGTALQSEIYSDRRTLRYRGNCSRNYAAQQLILLIMGLKDEWNHDVFFDYADRYIAWSRAQRGKNSEAFRLRFSENMWDRYRSDYGTVWTAPK